MEIEWTFFADWILKMLAIPVHALCILPFIALLGLAAGRRSNADLCLPGNLHLLRLGSFLAFLPPLYFVLEFMIQILPVLRPGANIVESFFSVAGLPWQTSVWATMAGGIFLWQSARMLAKVAPRIQIAANRYQLGDLKAVIWLLLCSGIFYFSSCFLINWPFAGLPLGLPLDRAIMAIVRNAVRNYFNYFTDAGAICLCLCLYYKFNTSAQRAIAMRWFAFWAVAGYFPRTLVTLGYCLGVIMRGSMGNVLSGGILDQMIAIAFMTCAMVCWLLSLVGKKFSPMIIFSGIILFVCYISAPFMIRLANALL